MDDNRKIALNSIIIFIRLCLVSCLGLITSRIVLDVLGDSDYGLYNVVGGIVILLNVVNSSMLSTTYRYIAFELGKGERGKSNKVFNTSFFLHGCFALLILTIGEMLGEWYINNYLNVSVGKLSDARFVFRISILTTAFSTLLVPYQGLLVAYEKFAITAFVEIIVKLINFLAIVMLLYSVQNAIRTYSLIMLFSTLLGGMGYLLYCFLHYWTIIKIRIYKDLKLYNEMLGYAFWTLFGACASVGKNQGSAIIINYFYGTIVNAAFGIANQVESFILMFSRMLNSAAVPQITKNFSGGNFERSLKLASYISKYTFFLMAIVAFPVILEINFLLSLWLKSIPEGCAIFCQLIILAGLLDCLGAGIPALVNATGNIRNYQIILHSFTLLGLPISFVFYKLGCNQYTISVVFCCIIGISSILRLYLLKHIFNFNIMLFINIAYIRVFYVSIPLVVVYILYEPSSFSFWEHIAGFISAEVILFISIFFLGIDESEWKFIRSIFYELKKKYIGY